MYEFARTLITFAVHIIDPWFLSTINRQCDKRGFKTDIQFETDLILIWFCTDIGRASCRFYSKITRVIRSFCINK